MTSFPVINGSAIADGKSRAIAWVNPRGKIDLVSFKDKKNFLGSKIPFLRGIAFLIFGIYIFSHFSCLLLLIFNTSLVFQ